MRLNRYLALAGLASRRACEEIILAGRVRINGHFVKNLATEVRDNDKVEVDGRPVKASAHQYWALNKPRGYHCTASDPEGRHTIFELLPPDLPRMFYVGRLDADSEGLLIVTNDGNLAQKLTHPSNH